MTMQGILERILLEKTIEDFKNGHADVVNDSIEGAIEVLIKENGAPKAYGSMLQTLSTVVNTCVSKNALDVVRNHCELINKYSQLLLETLKDVQWTLTK